MKAFTQLKGLVGPMDRANVDTDLIIPKQFLKSIKRSGFGPNAFDELRYLDKGEPGQDNSNRPINPEFPLNFPRYQGASILLARENFGCGSSREQACSTLKGHGLVVVAKSIARIFLQNSINLGLKVVLCPGLVADEGDELEFTPDHVLNRTSGHAYAQVKLPAARQGILDAGGLIPYTRKRLMAAHGMPGPAPVG